MYPWRPYPWIVPVDVCWLFSGCANLEYFSHSQRRNLLSQYILGIELGAHQGFSRKPQRTRLDRLLGSGLNGSCTKNGSPNSGVEDDTRSSTGVPPQSPRTWLEWQWDLSISAELRSTCFNVKTRAGFVLPYRGRLGVQWGGSRLSTIWIFGHRRVKGPPQTQYDGMPIRVKSSIQGPRSYVNQIDSYLHCLPPILALGIVYIPNCYRF
jgi:hypothetical protein